ncbi:hypothetical protein ERJ70_15245 [Sediminibacillus dalangtanensis]|uniref:Uncharacterized protein n=1 Tax=Sediminibacillus dalangtanensis TaxID=2729421 RepID=A0ABX7VV17_9BACI|nr:hypothetical protein [Sediminibacillus dalangtanensis]QTN00532.1 hypothetical protein ERJ70_15245 [Sediminibacillus dalangtanensis]
MKKVFFALISVSLFFLLISLNVDNSPKSEEERLDDVLDAAWNRYDVLAYMVLPEDSQIYFKIADQEDKEEFRQEMEKRLEENDLAGKYAPHIVYKSEEKAHLQG